MKYNSADFVHSGGDSDHQEVILYKCCVQKDTWVINKLAEKLYQ